MLKNPVDQIDNNRLEQIRAENWKGLEGDDLVRYYAAFLTQEEFDYWQPRIDTKFNSVLHLRQNVEAFPLLLKGLFAVSRLCGYGSAQWFLWSSEFSVVYHSLLDMAKVLDEIDDRIANGENITDDMMITEIKGLHISRF